MTLEFEVSNQFIKRTDNVKPVSDSINYLYAHFTFLTEEWQNEIITAIFTKDNISYEMLLDSENKCLVPHEILQEGGDMFVSCFCDNRVTATSSRVFIAEAGYTEEAENNQPPTSNIYDQLTTKFNELQEWVEEEFEHALDVIDGGNFTDW